MDSRGDVIRVRIEDIEPLLNDNQQALPSTMELFPLGGFGDGDLLVVRTDTASGTGGAVYRLYHDGYDESPLERIADDLASLLTELAENAMETYRAMYER